MDAAGDSIPDAHKYGIKRMIQAGVIPTIVESLVSEWMHDWDIQKQGNSLKKFIQSTGQ